MSTPRRGVPVDKPRLSYKIISNVFTDLMATTLGLLEWNIMLAVARLGREAYGAEVRRELLERTGRNYVVGAVYATLTRLEHKRFLTSSMSDPTPVRGGRARRQYEL